MMQGGTPQKRRTREHVIADLSINHVERFALRAGFTSQVIHSDYGLDLTMTTFDADGHQEPGLVFFQVKATDHLGTVRRGSSISVTVDERDLRLWLRETHPIILVIFDARKDQAHWGYVQGHFEEAWSEDGGSIRAFRTMRIPAANRLNDQAMMKIADLKRKIYVSSKG